ncbi:MAG: hypothetical protein B7733_22085 [Myxococcales bacterium FL481]|nr:MAG: hypothetical protein B7733_22085 [Myxococcales bacterium FL481]
MARVEDASSAQRERGAANANTQGAAESPEIAEADRREAEAFEAYLEGTGDGAAEFDELRRVLAAVGEMEPVQAPVDFYDQVTRKLRRRRLLSGEAAAAGLVSMPFQVISVLAILAVGALYLLAELDRDQRPLQREPSVKGDSEGKAREVTRGAP